jgi:hypothetical protein
MRLRLRAALAVALAVLMVGVLAPTLAGGISSQATPTAHTEPAGAVPANAIPPALFAYLTGVRHVPVSELDELSSSGVTPAELETMFDWESFGVSAAGGCLLGAATGAVGGAVGAGVGCAVGAAWAGLSNYWGQQDAADVSHEAEYTADSLLVQSYLNQLNETGAFALNALSALNQSQYAMDSAADSAALSQLPNSTYNPYVDLAASPVPFNLASVLNPITYSAGQIVNVTEAWLTSVYGTNGEWSGTKGEYEVASPILAAGSGCRGANNGGSYCTGGQSYYAAGVLAGGQTGTADLYIENGARGYVQAVSASCSITNVVNGVTYWFNSTLRAFNWSYPSGVWSFTQSTACYLGGYGILPLAGANTEIQTAGEEVSSGADPWEGGMTAVSTADVATVGQSANGLQVAGSPSATEDPFNFFNKVIPDLDAIATAAQENGRAYWTYLRDLGYTNENQVPPNCQVPMPAFSLPPSLADDVGNLSFNQTYSFYLAWLNSLATFFDTPPNATSFCQGHPIYHGPGGSAWADLDVNITGFIYVPGKAWSSQQTFVNSSVPTLGKTSSWSLNGSSPTYSCAHSTCGNASHPVQFTGWPTLASVSVPIGQTYEVPSNDPLIILPTAYLSYLTLTGNGTAVPVGRGSADSLVPFASSPGDALYITTCEVNGVPQASNCTLTFATINQTLPSIYCSSAPGGACNNPAPSGGGFWGGLPSFCGIPGIATLCSVFGGSLVNGVLSLVVLVVLALVVVWLVLWATGRRRAGGGGAVVNVGGR